MVLNLWNITEFVCTYRHAEEKMQVLESKMSVFYACPKYFPENRASDEPSCNNAIFLTDAQKAIMHISNKIEEMELRDITPNLTHYKFTIDNVDYKILEYSPDKIKIDVLNRKVIHR